MQKQIAELQGDHKKERELLIAEHEEELAKAEATHGPNNSFAEKPQISIGNGPVPHSLQDADVQKLESEILQLQQNVKVLRFFSFNRIGDQSVLLA